jgi:hypothetical protein
MRQTTSGTWIWKRRADPCLSTRRTRTVGESESEGIKHVSFRFRLDPRTCFFSSSPSLGRHSFDSFAFGLCFSHGKGPQIRSSGLCPPLFWSSLVSTLLFPLLVSESPALLFTRKAQLSIPSPALFWSSLVSTLLFPLLVSALAPVCFGCAGWSVFTFSICIRMLYAQEGIPRLPEDLPLRVDWHGQPEAPWC